MVCAEHGKLGNSACESAAQMFFGLPLGGAPSRNSNLVSDQQGGGYCGILQLVPSDDEQFNFQIMVFL